MKNVVLTFFFSGAIIVFMVALAPGMSKKPAEPSYVPGQVVLKFREGITSVKAAEIVKKEGALIGNFLERTRLCLVILPEGMKVDDAVVIFSAYPEVISAEPNFRVRRLEGR